MVTAGRLGHGPRERIRPKTWLELIRLKWSSFADRESVTVFGHSLQPVSSQRVLQALSTWNTSPTPATTMWVRMVQRMLRLLIDDVTLLRDERTIQVQIREKGGATT